MRRRRPALAVVALAAVLTAACGGDDGDAGDGAPTSVVNEARCLDADESAMPRVDLLFAAVDAVEAFYGSEQRYYEISVDRQRVSVIVADDAGNAAQSFYCGDAGFGPPESLGEASGATFVADDLDLDPDRVLSGIEEELDDPTVIDFVIQAAPDGVLYDATVQSDAGGVLLILLSPTGDVLAVQAT